MIKRVNHLRLSIILLLMTSFLFANTYSFAQKEDSVNTARLAGFLAGTGVAYTATMVALNEVWYSDFAKEKFHFFNDFHEWNQMDKIGHAYSTYHLSRTNAHLFEWSGINHRKSVILGTVMGTLMMIPIEIMDGFSSKYGASGSDIGANLLGAGLYLGQELLWNEVRIHPKFSFSRSGINGYRPNVLGKNLREELIKDYNGQTYWLSFDLYSLFFKKQKFISWLNIAFGYGINNMITANGQPFNSFDLEPYRQYYFALDLDLTHFKGKNKFVNTLIYFINMIHIPAPALEYNSQGKFIFHPIYF